MQDDQQVSEDKLREALARLGAGSGKSSNKQQPRPMPSSPERRRRFVRDGQVVVEHQSTGRPMSGRMQAVRAATGNAEDHDELERLRQSVKREQRRCEEAERHQGELKSQLRTFETREAHTKLQIADLSKALRDAHEQIQSLKSELHRAREEAMEASRRSPRPVGRPRKNPLPEQKPVMRSVAVDHELEAMAQPMPAGHEPEPYQWWKD